MIACLLGLTAFLVPAITLAVVVALFGTFAFMDGIFNLISGIRTRKESREWWLQTIQGLLGVVAGVVTVLAPLTVAIALLYLVAAWAISSGIIEIVAAIRLRKEIKGDWLLILSGLASIMLGIVLAAQPGAGLLVWLWWIGTYALASGIVLIVLSFKLRKLEKNSMLSR